MTPTYAAAIRAIHRDPLTLAHTQQKAPPLQAGALADQRILSMDGQAR